MNSNRLKITKSVSNRWDEADFGKMVSVTPEFSLPKTAKVFTIGSCFAIEIRKRLKEKGFNVSPDYTNLQLGPDVVFGKYPEKDTLAYYTTASIAQEITRCLHGHHYEQNDFLKIESPVNYFAGRLKQNIVYQDPYRRDVYAATPDRIQSFSAEISNEIRRSLVESDVVVITLGLTEAWKNKNNGLYVCKCPVNDHDPEWDTVSYHPLSYEENKTYLTQTIDTLLAFNPNVRIFLTVSPVPLGKTFSGKDVTVANLTGKATLRACAAEMIEKYKEHVFYWPSFEYTFGKDVYEADGRHVRPEVVENIVNTFSQAYFR